MERRAPSGSMSGIYTFMATVIGIPASLGMGYVVDRAINKPIYQPPVERHSIAVAPQVGLRYRATFRR